MTSYTFVGIWLFLIIGFGINYYFGVKVAVGAKIMAMTAFVEVQPYGGLLVWGEMGIGFLLYGKLRLVGHIMDTGFPTTAEIAFNKFPLDVR